VTSKGGERKRRKRVGDRKEAVKVAGKGTTRRQRMNGGKIEDVERSSVGGDTSRVEDNVWIRAIIEETLGDVEGCARRYFPRPLGTYPLSFRERKGRDSSGGVGEGQA